LRVQVESTVAAVANKFSQVWPYFRQVILELPEDITTIVPPDRVDLIFDAWSHLAAIIDTLQHEVVMFKLKEKEEPKNLL
jgi:putative heme iron utilization protein